MWTGSGHCDRCCCVQSALSAVSVEWCGCCTREKRRWRVGTSLPARPSASATARVYAGPTAAACLALRDLRSSYTAEAPTELITVLHKRPHTRGRSAYPCIHCVRAANAHARLLQQFALAWDHEQATAEKEAAVKECAARRSHKCEASRLSEVGLRDWVTWRRS